MIDNRYEYASSIYNTTPKPTVVDANYDNSQMSNSDFLKVLLADLQWQNPLDAKDITDTINNTVKLREIELMDKFSKALDSFSNGGNSLLSVANLIGKKIMYEGNQTYFQNGKSDIQINLESPASSISINILDQNGNLVDSKELTNIGNQTNINYTLQNSSLPDGYYTVQITAKDSNGNNINANLLSSAVVEKISKQNNNIMVGFNNNFISLDKIMEIGG